LQDTGDVLPRSGVAFVLVDPPSNRPQGFSSGERSRKDHAADIDAVIRYLRQELRVPVWLVGMSMGTVSVANAALHGAAGPDGVVFMAPVTAQYFGKAPFGEWLVTDFPLAELKVPVLAVIHEKDAPAREAKAFDGGYELSRDPCVGNSYHTFAGIRAQVAEYVADFIVKHSKQPR
jgi:pimeloyl-ACP methyl ester carboxylesterase